MISTDDLNEFDHTHECGPGYPGKYLLDLW